MSDDYGKRFNDRWERRKKHWEARIEIGGGNSHVWTGVFILLIGVAALIKVSVPDLPQWLFSWKTFLIALGLFWGNIIGIGILLAQKYFKLFPLNPDVYYVSEAPVYISLGYIVALNLGTFLICLVMLLVPSYIITKISPVKAMRFE